MKNIAKNLTLVLLTFFAIVGAVGSFLPNVFSMASYTQFLASYTPMFVTLLVSIGASKITDKIKNPK